jgi:glycosyltransferase involved in cell wall biosynthesis
MQINQVLVSASVGDAVTNAAFDLRDMLRRVTPSDIYASYIDPRLMDEVLELRRYDRRASHRPEGDILILHASIGEPELFRFLRQRPERLVVVYHNISPAEAFLPYDPAFAGLLEEGRRELGVLADRAVLALAVSEFNAAELRALGYSDVRVSPFVVDVARLRATEPDPDTANHLEQLDGPLVLFVGQLLPHKRPDLLVAAHHVLATYLLPEAHLAMVGAARLPRYQEGLQLFVQDLNLSRAWLTGSVTQEQLVAFYRHAGVFVTLSEHEGFCVPLLEAMSFSVPVLARARAAIPETLNGGGLLLPAESDPLLVAEAVAEVLENDRLRQDLVDRGSARLAEFDPDSARAHLLENLISVL